MIALVSADHAGAARLGRSRGIAEEDLRFWAGRFSSYRWVNPEAAAIQLADAALSARKKAAAISALRHPSKCAPSCWDQPECLVCGLIKKPKGRSMGLMEQSRCGSDCRGYYEDPQPGHLFRGEHADDCPDKAYELGADEMANCTCYYMREKA